MKASYLDESLAIFRRMKVSYLNESSAIFLLFLWKMRIYFTRKGSHFEKIHFLRGIRRLKQRLSHEFSMLVLSHFLIFF
jgi:hypothetical protein